MKAPEFKTEEFKTEEEMFAFLSENTLVNASVFGLKVTHQVNSDEDNVASVEAALPTEERLLDSAGNPTPQVATGTEDVVDTASEKVEKPELEGTGKIETVTLTQEDIDASPAMVEAGLVPGEYQAEQMAQFQG